MIIEETFLCKFSASLIDLCLLEVHERSCDALLLPFIEGKGNFTPSKDVYDEDEEVTLQCDEGFSPLVNDFAVCIDGFFVPQDFACVERIVGKGFLLVLHLAVQWTILSLCSFQFLFIL